MMQPPTPFNRTSFPVPSPTHRPRAAASNPNLKSGPPVTSISRLLAAAAAVTSSKTWVLQDGDVTGGVGLLVLALFGGRIWREVMERRRDRKGKRKEIGGAEVFSLVQLASSAILFAQAAAFFLAVRRIGPLRGSLLAITCSILGPLWKDDPGTSKAPIPFIPAILACAFVLFDAHKLHGPECLLNLFTLIALTLFLCGPWASTLELRSRGAKASGGGRLGRLVLTFCVSVTSLLGFAYLDIIPSPHLLSHVPLYHLALPLITAALVAYAPLPFAPSYDPKPAARFRTPRDYVIYLLAVVTLQFFALHPLPSTIDVLVLLPLVLSTIYLKPASDVSPPRSTIARELKFAPTPIAPSGSRSYWDVIPRAWRPHFQTILHTDSSRKIFYFLVINLAYMGVQMGYGVMTNSLGLISDAIHMFFDCLGIGIGLWASVAATWKPDGRYTFGYSRVETLSGFTNGLFLILISIFIIFEAIQRIMDPPEMEMRQLLLVSSIGLGINLFGMWATGGHHHHGHSHGHGHDHGHGHVHHKKEDHIHEDSHDHNHTHHQHDHSHTAHIGNTSSMSSQNSTHNRRRSSGKASADLSHHTHDHAHSHVESCHSHDHSHNHNHDHHAPSHTHDHDSKCDHDNDHAHNDSHKDHLHSHSHDHSNGHSSHGHDHLHDHDHGHAHSHEPSHSHHGHAHSHNMRGVFLHVMADTLGSVGVIISTLMIKYTGWTVFDPIASLFIAALIMASVIPLVIDSGRVLCLDVGVDCGKEIETALADLVGVEGLANFSAPRFWPRNEGELVGSIHIQLALSRSAYDPSKSGSGSNGHKGAAIYANADKVVARVDKILKSRIPGLIEMVIQVEGSEERVFCDCMTG